MTLIANNDLTAQASQLSAGKQAYPLRQSELVAQGQLAIQAANRVAIDVPEINAQSVSQTVDAMVAADPELAWLKRAEAQGDIDWRTVKEIHDNWDYSQSGLGKGAALAISIAAAAVVGPAVGGLAGSGLMGAMATGAAGSLAGTSAVSLINNRGNLGATLGDTFSSESLKGALIAAASAGASQQLDSVWGGKADPVTGKVKGLELNNVPGIGQFVGRNASQALADAGLQTAINGGSLNDNLQQSLKGAVTTVLEASLFYNVGDLGIREGLAESGPEKTVLHALAGGLAAEATGSDFRTGAIAAGANEALVKHLDDWLGGQPGMHESLLVAASKVTGIVAAGVAGGDVQKGAEIAGNATNYNYLAEHQKAQRARERETCKGVECVGVELKWQLIDSGQDRALAAGIVKGIADESLSTVTDVLSLFKGSTWEAIGQLLQQDSVLAVLGSAVADHYREQFDTIRQQYERAGLGGAFQAGRESGKLLTDIVSTLVPGGVAKKGVNVVAIAGKAGRSEKALTVTFVDADGKALLGSAKGESVADSGARPLRKTERSNLDGGAVANGTKAAGSATEAGSIFTQQRNFWSKDPIKFSGNKVYQRNDLFDPNLQTSWREGGKVITGTNVERMASGRAPIGVDGKSVNLHHLTQTQSGPIAEMTQTFHQSNSATIHINPNAIPSGIDRAAFNKWRGQYWQQRSADLRN